MTQEQKQILLEIQRDSCYYSFHEYVTYFGDNLLDYVTYYKDNLLDYSVIDLLEEEEYYE